ncbi:MULTISPECIES: DUF4145 domain-containing protein [unclassified Arsenophonus]|uniref:DUF4145 domain-containing protein n=1 Tax=unclassified Arsenophonus TaxID=2627083 RepID=UPI0028657279|nr:DUF4145 domain-containing protein [Arsenophonus sp.]MDR5611431.1 DUF4145 domain-containing protein [Arsenophonus sp.]MDR5615507.1 DUF4145 domain-containing protein [Arsenophonus sp.]
MGMLSFDITCPHCLKDNAVLEGFSERNRNNTNIYDVPFFCRSCEQTGVAVVKSFTNSGPYEGSCKDNNVNIVIPRDNSLYTLVKVYPEPKTNTCPDAVPIRAAKFFIESKDDLQLQRYETCVMNCRKVIDISTKELLEKEAKNEKLSQRISMLQAKDRITEQMKNWAHIIRIDSNGAVHSDEEFTPEEAEEILNFTELFLLYAFTLPAMVESRKHATTY